MLEPNHNLSALFRSLGPGDEKNSQVTRAADSPKTEQEWPLFKVLSPTKPEPTPPLTPQERKIWHAQQGVKGDMPKPALTLPGLSSKLAKSLSEISEQVAQEAASPVAQAPLQEGLGLQLPSDWENFPETQSDVAKSDLFKPSTSMEREEEKVQVGGLFQKLEAGPVLTQDGAKATGNAGDFLANVFNRLEAKEKVLAKPAEKRSSLMNRLGKR